MINVMYHHAGIIYTIQCNEEKQHRNWINHILEEIVCLTYV